MALSESDCLHLAPGAIALAHHERRADQLIGGRVTSAGGAAAGRRARHGVDLGELGSVEGLKAWNLHDLAPAAVLIAGNERCPPGYRRRVVPSAVGAVASACAGHRQDAASNAAFGIRLAYGCAGWRDARYLDGLAPAAVPLVGHEGFVCSASEIGRRRVASAGYAV